VNQQALAFGKALYDIRTGLGLPVAELAARAGMAEDDIERIEEGGTSPRFPCSAAQPPRSTPASSSPWDMTSAPSPSRSSPPELIPKTARRKLQHLVIAARGCGQRSGCASSVQAEANISPSLV
jgi:hypothetical protein